MAKPVLTDLNFSGVSRLTNLPAPIAATEAARFGDVEPTQSLTLTAGENMASGAFVFVDYATGFVFRADSSLGRPAHGYTRAAVSLGATVQLRTHGFLNGFSALVTGSPYFLGVAGGLTVTCPTSGIAQYLGAAVAADTLSVRTAPPVALAG